MGKQGKQGTLQQDIYTIICAENGIRTSELAQRLHVTRASAAGHIQELQRKGMIFGKGIPGLSYSWHQTKDHESLWVCQPFDLYRHERYY